MTQLHFKLDFEELKDEVMTSDLSDVLKSTIMIRMNQFMEKEREEVTFSVPFSYLCGLWEVHLI